MHMAFVYIDTALLQPYVSQLCSLYNKTMACMGALGSVLCAWSLHAHSFRSSTRLPEQADRNAYA